MTAFISGHINLTEDEFKEHYVPKIREAFRNGDRFVIGDAPGADTMAQKLLSRVCFSDEVTIFYPFNKPRNLVGNFKTVGGFKSYTERDAAMTKNSDYDIAWVRTGKENSGTAKNLKRRVSK